MSFPEVMIDRHQMPDVCNQAFIAKFAEQVVEDINSRISIIYQVMDSLDNIEVDTGVCYSMVGLLERAEEIAKYAAENPTEIPTECESTYAIINNIIETVGVIYENYMRVAQISALIKIVKPIIESPADHKVLSDASKIIEKNFKQEVELTSYDLYGEYAFFDRININKINQNYKKIVNKFTKIKKSNDEQIQKVENIIKRLLENGKLPPDFKPPDFGPMRLNIYYPPNRNVFSARKAFITATDNMGEPTDADSAARNLYIGNQLPKMAIAEFLGGRKTRKTKKSKRSRKSRCSRK